MINHILKRKISQMILLTFCLLLLASVCYAQPISSTELIENPKKHNGRELFYEGEVVGEVMKRKLGAWVNINDGENAIGVWMPHELTATINYRGSYKVKGDIVQVKGIFNSSCEQHGGDLDIHAISLRKIKSGWLMQEKAIPAKHNLLIILIVVLCLTLILRISIIR